VELTLDFRFRHAPQAAGVACLLFFLPTTTAVGEEASESMQEAPGTEANCRPSDAGINFRNAPCGWLLVW